MKQSDDIADKRGHIVNAKHLSLLSKISRTVNAISNVDEVLDIIIISAVEALNANKGSIMLFRKPAQELVIRNAVGINKKKQKNSKFMLGEGIAGWVAMHKMPLLIDDISKDERFVRRNEHDSNNAILCVPIIHKDMLKGVIALENLPDEGTFDTIDLEFMQVLSGQAAIAIDNAQLSSHLQKSYFDTISALANAVEAKDPYTLGHSERVTQYSITIAEQMGLSEDEIRTIQYSAILHDVGKIGVSGNILNKVGRLSFEEYCAIKQHCVIGENIIKRVDFLQETRPIIRGHQEHFDGSGYPDGLKGEEIPLLARILAVADVFDALITDRPYRKAYSYNDAVSIIDENIGKYFDPNVVKIFLDIFS